MILSPELRDFIQSHLEDDTAELLFAAKRYPGIDVPFAVEQIEARKKLKAKLPEWYANADLVMGGRVPAEQCSSEQTARYKQSIIAGSESLCDMTGGMGVDFYYMSDGMKLAIYTERQKALCENAAHNLAALGRGESLSIIRHGDGREMPMPDVDVIYLDPARRAQDGSRVYAIEDCEPNVIEWQDELLEHSQKVLVKLSPMIDITDALRKLKKVSQVHIVAVKNECKEVLILCEKNRSEEDEVRFHCIDFLANKTIDYHFSPKENSCTPNIIDTSCQPPSAVGGGGFIGSFLYEPDVTLMKAQAFNSLCKDFSIQQLDFDTRLMLSSKLIADFPGRVFSIDEAIPFSSKILKKLKTSMPKANIATRNFPLTADELRKRTGIKDGGDVYLFGAKVANTGNMLFKCMKV